MKKKPCLGCNQAEKGIAGSTTSVEKWSHGAPRETRIDRLVRQFGITGILRLLSLHFLALYERHEKDYFKVVSSLLRDFESVVERRGNEKLTPEEVAQAKKKIDEALRAVGVEP